MTKSSKTLLLVLGGVAIVGAGGAAIYLATKKPDAVAGKGSSPLPQAPNNSPKTDPTAGVTISATTEQLAQIANAAATMNLKTALELSKQPIDMGNAGGAKL